MSHEIYIKSSSLDALFKSTRQQFFWKFYLNLPNMCFRSSIWPQWKPWSTKTSICKWIARTNEATGKIVCMRVPYSVPEVNELAAQSLYPRRWSCLDRALPVQGGLNPNKIINKRGVCKTSMLLSYCISNRFSRYQSGGQQINEKSVSERPTPIMI
jgi:hypothetical protein